tara:strand:+ start:62 stop:442 length:381 start_codon:yes stop_codon:yes gene_type:complete
MELKELIGKEVIWKGNKCEVLAVDVDTAGTNVLKVQAEETETTKSEPYVDMDEVRFDVYFSERPRLFGTMVDVHDGWGKVEWKDADGLIVPFRTDSKTKDLILDKDNRPIMTMKIFDVELEKISLH